MGRRATCLGLTVAAIFVGAAGTAEGASIIGSNLSEAPSTSLTGLRTSVNTALGGASTAPGGVPAPFSGVITAWAVRASGPSGSGNTLTPRVVAGNQAVVTGITNSAPALAGTSSYSERLPIAAGQLFALQIATTGAPVSIPIAVPSAGATGATWLSPFADGENRPPDSTSSGVEILVQAVLEPDADSDGFGDETQDGCLNEAGPRGGCPLPAEPPAAPVAPETQIDSGPTGKVTRSKATFTFSSTSAGATFECALDKGGFTDCSSPKTVKKLANGKHNFRVRAISSAGLIDRSPAEQSFKVKLPKD
jgi:hypothetical protein